MAVTKELIAETRASVERMQTFDAETLQRSAELGSTMKFSAIVEPAKRLVSLYNKVNLTSINTMSEQMLSSMRGPADRDFQHFQNILDFIPDQGKARRDELTQRVVDAYDPTLNELAPVICFGFAEVTDFKALENNARSTLQRVEDMAAEQTKKLQDVLKEAQGILAEVKKTAAEQGVSKQATFFQQEAKFHADNQWWWLAAAGVFAALAALLVWQVKLPSEEWSIALANYVATKVLGFSLLAYAVFFCVKNYMAHRHNYVVNTHRQKALQTYRVLAKSAHSENEQDIVLAQAARCIFSPQNTGYVKTDSDVGGGGGGTNIIAMETVRRATSAKSPDSE